MNAPFRPTSLAHDGGREPARAVLAQVPAKRPAAMPVADVVAAVSGVHAMTDLTGFGRAAVAGPVTDGRETVAVA